MVDTREHSVEMAGTDRLLPPVSLVERLSSLPMSGSSLMPLPIPWKSGKQSPVPFPFGLNPTYSRIGHPPLIIILGIQVYIGWVRPIVVLVLPVTGGDLEDSLEVAWEVITTIQDSCPNIMAGIHKFLSERELWTAGYILPTSTRERIFRFMWMELNVMKRHRQCTPPVNLFGIVVIFALVCSIPGPMFVVLLRD